ncbi:MAG: DUF2267 domain-containing protein [Acidobacteria bacterium]|nr:DUF2267 domain-containing protein [Acidobacteriota bacterium]
MKTFDKALQTTMHWISDIQERVPFADEEISLRALSATLHALRDRLSTREISQLGAQLPLLIRGIYYEGWKPSAKPGGMRHEQQFLDHVRGEFKRDNLPIEPLVQAVLQVLSERISKGEIEDVKANLPSELRRMWINPTQKK